MLSSSSLLNLPSMEAMALGVEPGDPGFLDHRGEMDPGFADHPAEKRGPVRSLPQGQCQEVEVAGPV